MTRNQQPATAPTRITSPTDLIAAVPYLLGFTPAESVVLVGLAKLRVAVTIRTDIAAGEAGLTRAMTVPTFREVDRILLVAYTEHDLPQWLAMPPACTDALVVSAGRWRSLLCTQPGCCPPEGNPLPETTPPVVAAAVAAGCAPMPTREDITAALRPGQPSAEATTAATALLPVDARDRAWLAIDDMFRTGQDLHPVAATYLDIARHSEQDRQATAAWFLYAWTCWRLGDSIRARAAIEHLSTLDPTYRAAHLLEWALQAGLNAAVAPALQDIAGALS
jgi:hypothetical protein